ncbi:MAG: peptidylprolyl isomerase [Myxacorys chilensis ATA2-1-KO14]|nr:peptidylprolyl isomerase [Myxacorys chilensis ATA2-1-KO14]
MWNTASLWNLGLALRRSLTKPIGQRWFGSLKPRVLALGLAWSVISLTVLGETLPVQALPQGNAIKDPKALLRNALPIDNSEVRKLQTSLEDISLQLRANRRWGAVTSDIKTASRVLNDRPTKVLASIPDGQKAEAEQIIEQLKASVTELQTATDGKDKEKILITRSQMLDRISDLEAMMVKDFPFEVPQEYSNLPQLKGRATVAAKTSEGEMTIVLDGFSAPVTAGNFVDLVKRGFYDGLEFTRAEDSYVLQIGDPPGPEIGFVDPKTKKYRAVPMEILVKGEKEPVYGTTLEDAGRYLDQPVLPFSAYGALALAAPADNPNGGSSQFFFFLFEPELTPAGANLLDGRYSIFGFVTEGAEVLGQLKAGDKIDSMKVVDGLENLVEPNVA